MLKTLNWFKSYLKSFASKLSRVSWRGRRWFDGFGRESCQLIEEILFQLFEYTDPQCVQYRNKYSSFHTNILLDAFPQFFFRIHSIRSFFLPSFNFLKLSPLSLNFSRRNNFLIFFFSPTYEIPHNLFPTFFDRVPNDPYQPVEGEISLKRMIIEERKWKNHPPFHPYFRNAFVSGQATFKVPSRQDSKRCVAFYVHDKPFTITCKQMGLVRPELFDF